MPIKILYCKGMQHIENAKIDSLKEVYKIRVLMDVKKLILTAEHKPIFNHVHTDKQTYTIFCMIYALNTDTCLIFAY